MHKEKNLHRLMRIISDMTFGGVKSGREVVFTL